MPCEAGPYAILVNNDTKPNDVIVTSLTYHVSKFIDGDLPIAIFIHITPKGTPLKIFAYRSKGEGEGEGAVVHCPDVASTKLSVIWWLLIVVSCLMIAEKLYFFLKIKTHALMSTQSTNAEYYLSVLQTALPTNAALSAAFRLKYLCV